MSDVRSTTMTEAEAKFLQWLPGEGYLDARILPDGRWAALMLMMSTVAIVVGKVGDFYGIEDRWCYRNPYVALAALKGWAAVMSHHPHDPRTREPAGWHRNPRTGRRVAETESEYDQNKQLVPIGATYVRF